MTTWEAALEIVIQRTGHERWRVLCSEGHDNHVGARKTVMRLSGFEVPEDAAVKRVCTPRG